MGVRGQRFEDGSLRPKIRGQRFEDGSLRPKIRGQRFEDGNQRPKIKPHNNRKTQILIPTSGEKLITYAFKHIRTISWEFHR